MQTELFLPFSIGSLTLPNRFVRSAAADYEADPEGLVSPQQIERFVTLAKGGLGLIISGGIAVHPSGHIRGGAFTLDDARARTGWRQLMQKVEKQGAKVAIQLTHSGIWTSNYQNSIGKSGVAVSELSTDTEYLRNYPMTVGEHHALSIDEIEQLILAYVDSAKLAQEAGVHAIQIHAAHDSLLSQFLSPITNHRNDDWGGSLVNRTRMHREIIRIIRKELGTEFPVMLKIGLADGINGGLELADGLRAAELLAASGYDALEISQGLQDFTSMEQTCMHEAITDIAEEAYYRDWCRQLQKKVHIPLILSGGLRSYELVTDIINRGHADLIGMCRPFIREPNLLRRWYDGDIKRASCISCNKCLTELALKGKPIACYLDLKK